MVSKKGKPEDRVPVVQAIVLCDQVIQDAVSGKKSLIGMFDVLFARKYPATHPSCFLFAKISGAPRQKIITTWRVLLPGGDLMQDFSQGEVELNARGVGELVAQISPLQLPEAGDYKIILLVRDVEAAELTLSTRIFDPTSTAPSGSVH